MRSFFRALVPVARRAGGAAAAGAARAHHPDPTNMMHQTKGWHAALKEATIPTTKHDEEVARCLKYGLEGASSIEDRTIPTFSRGELPHFAGLNTFLKARTNSVTPNQPVPTTRTPSPSPNVEVSLSDCFLHNLVRPTVLTTVVKP